jgi:hydroxymethylpyrimidine/phosphomethylpyrimidine kinase
MGGVVPDRFFWALPPEDEEGADAAGTDDVDLDASAPPTPRSVH